MVTDSLRYWVQRDACRRLPLRPRHDSGPRAARVRRGRRASSMPAGRIPCCRTRQADRRAVGMRAGRLSGRALSARLGRVERPLSRHGAGLLARRRRQAADLAARLTASADLFDQARAQAMGLRQFHHGARRIHARRSRLLQRQAQRGERREQPGRPRRTISRTITESKDRPTMPRSTPARLRQMRNMLATLFLVAGHADAARLATSSRAARTATTTPTARTTRSPGSTGKASDPRSGTWPNSCASSSWSAMPSRCCGGAAS